ncbi:MAG: hypothetical protein ABIA75_08145 [Candidatus Neomarinimicrobiota bacterium]
MANHIIIQNALLCEARPLIDYYHLKKDFSYTKFDVFRNDRITLIVSGIGRLKATIAATHILDRRPENQDTVILNLGIAGSTRLDYGIGKAFLINKIIDTSTGRNYYPDLLYRHNLPEIQIATFDKVVIGQDAAGDYSGLVDMEAAGFAAAALTFLGPHQIALLKIISDHLKVDHLTADNVAELVRTELPTIDSLVATLQELPLTPASQVNQLEQLIVDTITQRLRLTAAQQRILRNDLFGCHIRFGEIPTGWKAFTATPSQSKTDRNRRFAELRKFLSGK